jgi:transglutaminase-like putative cysteine protease
VDRYLGPTPNIDCDERSIQEKARELTSSYGGTIEKAQSLFYFVRDQIKYNPYVPRHLPEHFQASKTLAKGQGFCIPKSVLFVALARAAGIPGRLGFAVIRNHLLPQGMTELLRSNLLPDHGYAELYLNGKWVKATTAFDAEMCRKHKIIPVEFDGRNHAKYHSHTLDGKLHIEYVTDRGPYEDLPLEEIRQWVIQALKPEAIAQVLGP